MFLEHSGLLFGYFIVGLGSTHGDDQGIVLMADGFIIILDLSLDRWKSAVTKPWMIYKVPLSKSLAFNWLAKSLLGFILSTDSFRFISQYL